ncbi:MAG: hypothetical protein NPIRA01_23970 [Nitrospirales bacterium]|nr:MAG: hypothetical protein NPIRA01_23970 [Nitrospirales bacterium]
MTIGNGEGDVELSVLLSVLSNTSSLHLGTSNTPSTWMTINWPGSTQ